MVRPQVAREVPLATQRVAAQQAEQRKAESVGCQCLSMDLHRVELAGLQVAALQREGARG